MLSQPHYTISIAMATYNGERFLLDQLQSFLYQTRPPDELVICDDGSSDNTLAILESFSRQAPFPIRLFENAENLGYGKNFEKAASLCSGDIIVFSDQDDVWLPYKLAKIHDAFSETPGVGLVFSNASVVNNKLEDLGYSLWDIYGFKISGERIYKAKEFTPWFFGRRHIHGCTMAILKEIILKVMQLPEYWSHDQWFPFWASFLSSVVCLQDNLIKYRKHPHQTTGPQRLNVLQKIFFHSYRDVSEIKYDYLVTRLAWIKAYETILSNKNLHNDYILNLIANYLRFHDIIFKKPKNRIKRFCNLLPEYKNGSYNLFNNGVISFIKDIIF